MCLVVLAAALPVLVYLHFDHIEAQRLRQAYDAMADRDRLIARGLTARLAETANPKDEAVRNTLAGLASAVTRRWLVFVPADEKQSNVRIVALPSAAGSSSLDGAADAARPLQILRNMPASCVPVGGQGVGAMHVNPGPRFASIVSIPSVGGCWFLVSEESRLDNWSPLAGRPLGPLWDAPLLLLLYVAALATAIAIGGMIGFALRHFRTLAYDVGQYRAPVGRSADGMMISELAGAAEVLDGLVLDISRISQWIRQSAEDNAHSLKTPLAVVRAAVGRIRRHVSGDSEAVRHALAAADQAVDRLFLLIETSQRLDEDTAALIVAPRQLIDFTELIQETSRQFSDLMAARHIKCVLRLPKGILVRAGIWHLETVLHNVVDHAVSSSPEHGLITLSLARTARTVDLRVEVCDGGLEAEAVDRLFERDYSTPDTEVDESNNSPRHARPSLFVVKRNIEALGGSVIAEGMETGSFAITMVLPRPRR
jgi:two-component system sensor histidine kinase ChvG